MGKGKKKDAAGGGKSEKDKTKLVEDKTFGMKNKKNSKKVQNYIKQVEASQQGGKTSEYQAAQAAKKKAEKEAKKQAEKEMLALLGEPETKGQGGKSKKGKKGETESAEAREQRRREEHERDFGVPITSLDQIVKANAKAIVVRACAVMESKEALARKTAKNEECMKVKISDGTTRRPVELTLIGWNPSTFSPKADAVLDIRDAVAMVRGEKVELEVTQGTGSVTEASQNLAEYVINAKQEQDEIREKGGLPIEELIEEQRAQLDPSKLTPVTKERFFEWKEQKRRKREAEWEEKRKDAAKKSGSKGLNVLSGKALFAYDPTLFKDDDAALGHEEVSHREPNNEDEKENESDSESDNDNGDDSRTDQHQRRNGNGGEEEEEEEDGDEEEKRPEKGGKSGGQLKGQNGSRSASQQKETGVSVDEAAVDLQENLYLDDEGDVDLEDLDD